LFQTIFENIFSESKVRYMNLSILQTTKISEIVIYLLQLLIQDCHPK